MYDPWSPTKTATTSPTDPLASTLTGSQSIFQAAVISHCCRGGGAFCSFLCLCRVSYGLENPVPAPTPGPFAQGMWPCLISLTSPCWEDKIFEDAQPVLLHSHSHFLIPSSLLPDSRLGWVCSDTRPPPSCPQCSEWEMLITSVHSRSVLPSILCVVSAPYVHTSKESHTSELNQSRWRWAFSAHTISIHQK